MTSICLYLNNFPDISLVTYSITYFSDNISNLFKLTLDIYAVFGLSFHILTLWQK